MGVLKDFDCSNIQHETAGRDPSSYNVIRAGMSYSGYCRNPNCKDGFQKMVVCNRGHGHHLINDDILNDVIKCPCCSKKVNLDHISLFRCKAKMIVHSTEDEEQKFEATGDQIVKIGSKVGEAAFENYLMSIIVETPKSEGCVMA